MGLHSAPYFGIHGSIVGLYRTKMFVMFGDMYMSIMTNMNNITIISYLYAYLFGLWAKQHWQNLCLAAGKIYLQAL
eukprot:12089844-Karenia_brevis.AAC.1